MDGDELALEMGRELGDRDAVLACLARDLVAVVLALRGAGEIEETPVPGRDLHALVAALGRPGGDGVP
jgi:hypothetical protein